MIGLGLGNVKAGGVVEFIPTSISNLQLWLQNGVGITSSSDPAAIDTWADSSGNGNDAGHPADTYRPRLDDGGGLWFGDSDEDSLELDSTITLNSFHIFLAISADAAATNSLLTSNNSTDFLRIGQGNNANNHRLKANNAFTNPAQFTASTAIATDGTKQLLEYRMASASDTSSNNFTLKINGNLESTISFNSDSNAFDIKFVGAASNTGTSSFRGHIYEVLIYSSALTDGQSNLVRNYLNSKLNIYS
jgi:hypothetical protein